MFNPRYSRDVRRAVSGKDTCIFNEDGDLLATVDSFQATVNFTNASYLPLGTAQTTEHMVSYTVSIAISQVLIESDEFLRGVTDFFSAGRHAPMWTLQSVVYGYDGSEERLIFRDCVPTGSWDLHNLSQGDVIKRTLNLTCNQPPELQKLLTYAE